MRSLKAFSLGMLIVMVLTPLCSRAQASLSDPDFTEHAFLMGFLILSVIVLVFLGLLLTARVNELRNYLKKPKASNKKDNTAWKKLMSLDQSEIKNITELRQEQQNATMPPPQSIETKS